MSDEIREAVEAAVAAQRPAEDAPAEVTEAAPEAEPAEAAPEATAPAGERPRGPDGKFVPKAKDATPPAAKASETAPAEPKAPAKAAPTPAAKPAAPVAVKAPQSWKPAVREKWSALPPEVQEEVQRREGEVARVLSETAQARRVAENLERVVGPYRPLLGPGDPLQAVGGLLQTFTTLRTGTASEKAAITGNIIRNFGIDVKALAADLNGQAPAPPQQSEYRDPRVDQIAAYIQQQEHARVQQEHARVQQVHHETNSWVDQQEFGQDQGVKHRMGVLLQSAADMGLPLTLEQAYDEAIWAAPSVREALLQRQAAKSTATANAATQRAKAASVSVRSQPVIAPEVEEDGGDEYRGAVLSAMKRVAAR